MLDIHTISLNFLLNFCISGFPPRFPHPQSPPGWPLPPLHPSNHPESKKYNPPRSPPTESREQGDGNTTQLSNPQAVKPENAERTQNATMKRDDMDGMKSDTNKADGDKKRVDEAVQTPHPPRSMEGPTAAPPPTSITSAPPAEAHLHHHPQPNPELQSLQSIHSQVLDLSTKGSGTVVAGVGGYKAPGYMHGGTPWPLPFPPYPLEQHRTELAERANMMDLPFPRRAYPVGDHIDDMRRYGTCTSIPPFE
jgi:hypothetical protein